MGTIVPMLTEITIDNLGVISHATAEFSSGLSVVTGETGAGKTMVVSSLRLLCGSRADASRVRSGADRAVVEGRFSTSGLGDAARGRAEAVVEEVGGVADDNGEFIALRSVTSAGRSKAHLGGRSVPAAALKEFSEQLITVHGQNDQLRLLAADQQRAAVDAQVGDVFNRYEAAWSEYRRLAKDLQERTLKRRELAQEIDRLRFAIDEIDAVAPVPGEDAELVELIRRLQDVDTVREQAVTALHAIDGVDGGGFDDSSPASDLLGQAAAALAGDDPELAQLSEQLSDITSQLGDISVALGSFLSGLPSDPSELDRLLQRQGEIKSLTRKYAPDCEGVVAWRAKAAQRLEKIDVSSDALGKLEKEVQSAHKEALALAKQLSKARQEVAARLSKQVTAELAGLAMGKSRFEVAVSTVELGPHGIDEVEFRLAPMPGAEARPLASSASGGELSRVMLALELFQGADTRGATLVFDEVDAGVGGVAAVEIGRRLAQLAKNNQVIVVTHLPQVAAYADMHLHVSKHVGDDTVTSGVEELSRERRIEELSRMLAGLADTETGRAHAEELLDRAQQECAEMRAG